MDAIDERLDELLESAEPALGDDAFSDLVMRRLPRQRLGAGAARPLTLASAAAIGSLLTILLAPPINSAFGLASLPADQQTLVLAGGAFVVIVGLPLAWLYFARRGRVPFVV